MTGVLETGQAALRDGRWADAREAFEWALGETPEGDSLQAVALAGLGEALWWLGESRQSVRIREQAYAACRRAGDTLGAVAIAIALTTSYRSDFDNHATASGWLARAERLADTVDVGQLQGWLWVLRGFLMRDTDPRGARALLDNALDLAQSEGIVDLELTALSNIGVLMVVTGDEVRGLALIDEAMAGALGGERTTPDTVVYTSCNMLVACDLSGDLERATQWSRAIDNFVATYGCPFLYAECRTRYGSLLLTNGLWDRAEIELATALTTTEDVAPALHDQALGQLAELRIRQGRLEEAGVLLSGVRNELAVVMALASHRLACGEPERAVPLLERRLRHLDDGHAEVPALLALLADVQLARGEIEHASALAAQLADLASSRRQRLDAALAVRTSARVAAARGQVEEAAGEFERALVMFAELDLSYETAQVRMELARAVVHLSPDVSVTEARSALSAFERLGAATYIDAAHAVLRQLGAARSRAPSAGSVLTAREQEVLQLVAHGMSNPEIANRLFISRKTAAHHVSNLLSKLGLRNRAEAAAYATRRLKWDQPAS